jgi:MFS family permease
MVANPDRFSRVEPVVAEPLDRSASDGSDGVVEPGAMVINAEDIDLRPLYVAVGAWLVGIIVVALLIALVAQWSGRRRLGCVSMILAVVVTVAGLIVAFVATRILTREATIPDVLWALALAAVTTLCLRILLAPAAHRDES